jgi:hypothetical protein
MLTYDNESGSITICDESPVKVSVERKRNMSTSYSGIVVTFEKDVHEDDIEHRLNAIRMIRGVLSVEAVERDYSKHIAVERMRHDLWEKVRTALFPEK